MIVFWGLVLQIFTLFWLGQLLCVLAPGLAQRLGLIEPAGHTDRVILESERADAIWDSLGNWVLPLAGVLMILDHPAWPYWALAGGGMNVYTAGQVVVRRLWMPRAGIAMGTPAYVRMALFAALFWGVLSLITLAIAVRALTG